MLKIPAWRPLARLRGAWRQGGMPENAAGAMFTGRLVHIHIPKTAGVAIKTAFRDAFGSDRVFPPFEEDKYVDPAMDKYDIFSGHIGYTTACRLGGDIVTVLREPVARFVSCYFYLRRLYETGIERSPKSTLAARYSLEEFVKIRDEPCLIQEFQDRMTWQIASGYRMADRRRAEKDSMSQNDVLALAAEHLRSFAEVGFQDNLADFRDRLQRRYGVPMVIKMANVTKKSTAGDAVTASVRREIERWLPLDQELYRIAAQGRAGAAP